MDWWGGKVSLGNLDLAGAVNKLQESVKNIEKNFDNALGLEDSSGSASNDPSQSSTTEASSSWSSTNRKALFNPVMAFMGHSGEEDTAESKSDDSPQDEAGNAENENNMPEQSQMSEESSLVGREKSVEADVPEAPTAESTLLPEDRDAEQMEQKGDVHAEVMEDSSTRIEDSHEDNSDAQEPVASPESVVEDTSKKDSDKEQLDEEEKPDAGSSEHQESVEAKTIDESSSAEAVAEPGETEVIGDEEEKVDGENVLTRESSEAAEAQESTNEVSVERGSPVHEEVSSSSLAGTQIDYSETAGATTALESRSSTESADANLENKLQNDGAQVKVPDDDTENNANLRIAEVPMPSGVAESNAKGNRLSSASNVSDSTDSVLEMEKVKKDMKMMEAALQGAARQAQAKADEIAKLMNENEQLKLALEDLRRKSNDAEVESLREEYHQRVATLERKVYALTKERDTLRREQNKRSDAAALLKEKDEIITQVMAEGEELSKKQAAQEATIRKLRAQVRELEEDRKANITKLQLEENKVESIKKDKAATEKLLQETIEKHQAELAGQKEYYTAALNAAKEAEELAEARANNEARSELESRLQEAGEREAMLIQALDELRQTLTRQEQQAIDKEERLRRDVEDLQKRYQESERRCEELVSQLPESTRPLLRQIEAMQETSARKAEAWSAVERTLQSRLQEAEAKAAGAEERERSINERLSQTLSRVNVLEAQISCLRAEQTQLNRSLEKERQRAAENRQEYLAAKEVADTHEGHVNQLEEEIKDLRRKQKNELQEALAHRELLQQELEREKALRIDLEKAARLQSPSDQSPTVKNKSALENGKLTRKLQTASSVGSMEESFFLQSSLESSGNFLDRRNSGEATMSPYYLKSMTPSAFEAALRQKEGELASYMTRLTSLESIRDSLAEELVKMTEQCEKLRSEASILPGIKAELDALRRRHSAALELMGERDEELEELRADIVDLKEMYREQVNLLVNKIQGLGSR